MKDRTIGLFMLGVVMAALIAGTLALQSRSVAADTVISATIDSAQAEAAGTCGGSAASGTAKMSYNQATNLFSWDITFGGFSGAVVAIHFHGPAAPGLMSGVQVVVAEDFQAGLTSPISGSTNISLAQADDMLSNLWYLNIHTEDCGDGEIRGQVEISVGGVAELSDLAATPADSPSSSNVNPVLFAGAAAVAAAMTLGAGLIWSRRRHPD